MPGALYSEKYNISYKEYSKLKRLMKKVYQVDVSLYSEFFFINKDVFKFGNFYNVLQILH